jgi:hypothetical protein
MFFHLSFHSTWWNIYQLPWVMWKGMTRATWHYTFMPQLKLLPLTVDFCWSHTEFSFFTKENCLSGLSRVFHKKDITLSDVTKTGCRIQMEYVTKLCKVDGMLVHSFDTWSFMFLICKYGVYTLHERCLSLLKKSELIILKIVLNTQLHCEQNAGFNVKAVVLTIVL